MVPSYLWRLTSDGVPNFFNRRLIEFLGVDAGDANVAGVHPLSLLSLGPSCIRMTRHA
jgi:hypothetical protein